MAETKRTTAIVGRLVGLAILIGGIAAVVLIDWSPPPVETEFVVRPLKTMVVGESFAGASRQYPGKVRANQEVDLSFQVPGPLIEFPVKKGQKVEQGEVLGRLDPRDYENTLQARQGALDKAKEDHAKIERLYADGNAGRQEWVDAKAALDVADAEARTATKALDDTYLRAPFAGVVANTFVENFQDVAAKQKILSLQDVSDVEIEVNVPEERVIRAQRDSEQKRYRFVALFEYLPGREFAVEVKEFTTDADPRTQTYAARFTMPAPEDALILPGMTATIKEYPLTTDSAGSNGFPIPLDAVPVDEATGAYFVWLVTGGDDGSAATVQRRPVAVGNLVDDRIVVLDGLARGDRIALAGTHLLLDGQRVKPFAERRQGGKAQ